MSELSITNLNVSVGNKPIVKDFSIEIKSGEIHALMGPNGSGKSTLSNALMGKAGYEITSGEFEIDGKDLLGIPTWKRAQAGLFLTMQYPVEVPGVSTYDVLSNALPDFSQKELLSKIDNLTSELNIDKSTLDRGINVDFSGGEKKRNETLQLSLLNTKFAIIDELDSGLDIDSLRKVSEKIKELVNDNKIGILLITHYKRILEVLKPDYVHIFSDGSIVKSGDYQLAEKLEEVGYSSFRSS